MARKDVMKKLKTKNQSTCPQLLSPDEKVEKQRFLRDDGQERQENTIET